jgi:phage head maturation protease
MKRDTTYVWGVAADSAGLIHYRSDRVEELAGGGVAISTRNSYDHEPASSYAAVHPAPMPLRWRHGEEIGRVVALRRQHGRLYVLAETDITPDELQALAGNGRLKWSTSTAAGRSADPLRVTEVSLTPEPATVGLPAVSWYKLDVTKSNPPMWVREELDRASKAEHRSRRELRVHEVGESPIELEHRDSTPPIEMRAAIVEDVNFPERIIEVLAAPYGQEAIVEYRGQLWRETIDRGAFDGVEKRPNRVKVFRNHEDGPHRRGTGVSGLIGRVVSFSPERDEGLVAEAKIAKTPLGDETLTLAGEGVLGVSIGFGVKGSDQVLNQPPGTRRIRRAYVDHLAFPDNGAYEGAGVLAVRSRGQDAGDVSPVETPRLDEVVAWLESR